MKKRILTILLLSLLLSFSVLPAFAVTDSDDLLADEADLLTGEEETALRSRLKQYTESLSCDIAVLTVNGTGGKDIQEFADDTFDYSERDYGCGSEDDGILLVVDMGQRRFAVTTYGVAYDAFNDAEIDLLLDGIYSCAARGDWAAAFDRYAELARYYIHAEITGENDRQDGGDTRGGSGKGSFPVGKTLIISLIIGLVISLIILSSMKKKLKSVRKSTSAGTYVRPGSLNLTTCNDLFLYTNVTKTRRETDSRSGGSHSGGGGSHVSSSGRTHGGGSRSF